MRCARGSAAELADDLARRDLAQQRVLQHAHLLNKARNGKHRELLYTVKECANICVCLLGTRERLINCEMWNLRSNSHFPAVPRSNTSKLDFVKVIIHFELLESGDHVSKKRFRQGYIVITTVQPK